PKNPQEIARLDKLLREREEREAAAEAKDAALRAAKRQELADKLKAGDAAAATGETAVEAESEAAVEAAATDADAAGMLGEDGEPMTEDERAAQHKRQLKKLIQDAKTLLKDGQDKMSAKHKQRVRLFLSEAKRAISRLGKNAAALDPDADLSRDSVMTQLATILKGLNLDHASRPRLRPTPPPTPLSPHPRPGSRSSRPSPRPSRTPSRASSLRTPRTPSTRRNPTSPLAAAPLHPPSPSSPLPRGQSEHLRRRYLRHPVARRGEAEVPTPFPIDQNQLAFNWYLRMR
ncbi:hypothetical protein EV126DRAFT_515078, partial [Verticillium dahliae]